VSDPALVVCCGLPGAGKSTVSAYVAERLDAARYRSDEVRKELVEEPTYEADETTATYDELIARAKSDLADGGDVVLDATFSSQTHRDRVYELGRTTDAEVEFVLVTCDADVLRRRIEERTETVSDAGYDEHLEVKASFDPFDRDHVEIDNAGSLQATYRQLDRMVLESVERGN